MKEYNKTNEDQWTSIYTNQTITEKNRRELEEKLKEIEIEVRTYQKMFSLILSKNKELSKNISDKITIGIIERERTKLNNKDLEKIIKELEKKKILMNSKKPSIPFHKQVEQFKRQQIQQRSSNFKK